MNSSNPWRITLAALIALLVTACASTKDEGEGDETKDWTAEQFYTEGKQALNGGDFETAIKSFEKLETRYPFGRYAQQAQLETAYAYYKNRESESAIAGADRFIKLHPTHPHVDYAYYLRGLASFPEPVPRYEILGGKNPNHIDGGTARRSFDYFAELIKKYPDSQYSEDARNRMAYLRNALAQHETSIAAFYLDRRVYVAAANRAKYVVEHYQRTPAMIDALAIMARAYHALDLNDLAADAVRVLELNNPNYASLTQLKEDVVKSKIE